MAINSLSTGFRPGVCTSGTRPTAPYEGQQIYETDTDLLRIWNGSAWLFLSTPQATEIGVWETWTPTVTSSGGTITAYVVNSARYSRIQKLITGTIDITITTVGTASGVCIFTLPITASTAMQGGSIGSYRERSVTGDMGFIYKNTGTTAHIIRFDQGAIFNSGRTFSGTFTYEAA